MIESAEIQGITHFRPGTIECLKQLIQIPQKFQLQFLVAHQYHQSKILRTFSIDLIFVSLAPPRFFHIPFLFTLRDAVFLTILLIFIQLVVRVLGCAFSAFFLILSANPHPAGQLSIILRKVDHILLLLFLISLRFVKYSYGYPQVLLMSTTHLFLHHVKLILFSDNQVLSQTTFVSRSLILVLLASSPSQQWNFYANREIDVLLHGIFESRRQHPCIVCNNPSVILCLNVMIRSPYSGWLLSVNQIRITA